MRFASGWKKGIAFPWVAARNPPESGVLGRLRLWQESACNSGRILGNSGWQIFPNFRFPDRMKPPLSRGFCAFGAWFQPFRRGLTPHESFARRRKLDPNFAVLQAIRWENFDGGPQLCGVPARFRGRLHRVGLRLRAGSNPWSDSITALRGVSGEPAGAATFD